MCVCVRVLVWVCTVVCYMCAVLVSLCTTHIVHVCWCECVSAVMCFVVYAYVYVSVGVCGYMCLGMHVRLCWVGVILDL